MSRYFSLTAGFVAMMVVPLAWGEDREPSRERQREEGVRNFEFRERQLRMQRNESELAYENELRKIQLELKKIELDRERKSLQPMEPPPPSAGPWKAGDRGFCGPMGGRHPCKIVLHAVFLAVCAVVHILLALWVYQDIRKRNAGSSIWIAVVLLTGFFGGFLYALVRVGDRQG